MSALPEEVAAAVCSHCVRQSYSRGEIIFLQGDPARTLFIVIEGWVKLYRIAQSGEEAVVGVFTEGQSFGEVVVLKRGNFPVAAEAVTDCRLMQVHVEVLFDLMRRYPEVVGSMMASMYGHFHALVGQIEQLKARTGAQRVAEFLLELCPVEEGACTVHLPYDKILIAGRLGMKPESLSRAFFRLKSAGVSVVNDNAAIADVGRLRAYAEQDRAVSWSRTQ
jgi:CRP-like cAMP-binding protein